MFSSECQIDLYVLPANHIGIAKSLQYPSIKEYRYWDYEKCCVDFEGMIEDLRVIILFSVVLQPFLNVLLLIQIAAVFMFAYCPRRLRCSEHYVFGLYEYNKTST